jgi:hypothetical protein
MLSGIKTFSLMQEQKNTEDRRKTGFALSGLPEGGEGAGSGRLSFQSDVAAGTLPCILKPSIMARLATPFAANSSI